MIMIVVDEKQKQQLPEVGDLVVFFDRFNERKDTYIICYNEYEDEYFMINIMNGVKRKLVTYDSIEELMESKKNYKIVKSNNAILTIKHYE